MTITTPHSLFIPLIALFLLTAPGCENTPSPATARPPASSEPEEVTSLRPPSDILEAAARGSVDDVRGFLDLGADIDSKDRNGNSLVHLAARDNPDAAVLAFLIERGADIDVKNRDGWTPIYFAAGEKKEAIFRSAKAGQDEDDSPSTADLPSDVPPSVQPKLPGFSETPYANLCEAAKEGGFADIRFFVEEERADVNRKNSEGRTPLQLALGKDCDLAVVRYLIGNGATINTSADGGVTPLHTAAGLNSHVDVLKYLVEHGADLHARTTDGATPLHSAAILNPRVDVLEYLLLLYVNIDEQDFQGWTPLHYVAKDASGIDKLKTLIAAGANVHAKNVSGITPLHIAAFSNSNIAILEYLIERGADINTKAVDDITPLHSAAFKNPSVAVLEFLIVRGADVSARTNDGKTPLDYADTEAKKAVLRAAGKQP